MYDLQCTHWLLCGEQNRMFGAQSGGWEPRQESLLLVSAVSCVSSSQLSCNLFQGRLFWSVWKTHCLAPGNLVEPKKLLTSPSPCFPFLCNPIKCAHTSLFPRQHPLPPNAQSAHTHCHVLLKWCELTNLPKLVLTKVQTASNLIILPV